MLEIYQPGAKPPRGHQSAKFHLKGGYTFDVPGIQLVHQSCELNLCQDRPTSCRLFGAFLVTQIRRAVHPPSKTKVSHGKCCPGKVLTKVSSSKAYKVTWRSNRSKLFWKNWNDSVNNPANILLSLSHRKTGKLVIYLQWTGLYQPSMQGRIYLRCHFLHLHGVDGHETYSAF